MSDDIGHIYLAINSAMPGLVKIGLTKGDVRERMKELSADTGVPAPFKCAYFCKVQNPAAVEKQLHKEFVFCRESGNREFFRIDWRAVKAALRMMQADSKRVGENLPDDSVVSQFALVKYVKEGYADKVRQALAISRCNPNQTDENNQTSLMWAAKLGQAEIVGILINGKADPNKTDKAGGTALMLSAQSGHANIAKALLDCGAHVDAENKQKQTALMMAASAGHAEVVKVLLEGGASSHGAMYRAAEAGHMEVVKMFLDNGESVGFSLYGAVSAGHVEIVKVLLENGGDSYLREDEDADSDTVLMVAARRGDVGIVKALLESGAYPNATSGVLTHTALGYGISANHAEVVKMLLDGGANLSDNDLMSAAEVGNAEVVKMLLDGGADPNAMYRGNEETALIVAAKAGHAEAVKVLLDGGADPNAAGNYGKTTALTAAVRAGHAKAVKVLLDSGAMPYGGAKKISTVLHRAAHAGHVEIVRMLLNSGLQFSAYSIKSSLGSATHAGHADIVKMLRERDTTEN